MRPEGACKASLTWTGSCWLMPLVQGLLGAPGTQKVLSTIDFVLSGSPACSGDGALALDKGQPPTFGLGIAPVLWSRVCTTILHVSKLLVAVAPYHVDLLTVFPGLLAGSL